MLTLTCEPDRRGRNSAGNVLHILRAVNFQVVAKNHDPETAIDLDRVTVTVRDPPASRDALLGEDLDVSHLLKTVGFDLVKGGVQIVLTSSGAMYYNIFLGQETVQGFLADLDFALASTGLLVSFTITDQSYWNGEDWLLDAWLSGERYATDIKLYQAKPPALTLVRRHP